MKCWKAWKIDTENVFCPWWYEVQDPPALFNVNIELTFAMIGATFVEIFFTRNRKYTLISINERGCRATASTKTGSRLLPHHCSRSISGRNRCRCRTSTLSKRGGRRVGRKSGCCELSGWWDERCCGWKCTTKSQPGPKWQQVTSVCNNI